MGKKFVKVVIHKCNFPLDRAGTIRWDAQVWRSLDGKGWYHCGEGLYCRTRKEARAYKKKVETA